MYKKNKVLILTAYLINCSLLLFCSYGHSQTKTNIIKGEDNKRLDLSYPPIIDDFSNNLNTLSKMEKPSNRLYMTSTHCQFELLVNDVPINSFRGEATAKGSGMTGDNLLNPFILRSGEHEIKVKIYPRFGKDVLESYSFFSYDIDALDAADYDNQVHFMRVETPDKRENGSVKNALENLPYYEMQTKIKLEVPFNLTGWTNSVDLRGEHEKKNIEKELLDSYQQIHAIFKNKKWNELKELIAEREDMLGTAFYYTEQQKKDRWKLFENELNNDDYELAPLPSNAALHFYGYGKMAVLLDEESEGIIKLINKKDSSDVVVFDFRFHRKSPGSKLTVI